MTRTLLLMRHAKAVVSAGPDRDRELSPRGVRSSVQMADVVSSLCGGQLDLAVVSSAVRTRQTWAGLQDGGVHADDVWFDSSVYLAHSLLPLLSELPEDASTVLVVGHAPSIPALGLDLSTDPHTGLGTRESDPTAYRRLAGDSFPTGSVLALTLSDTWADVTLGCGTLLAFVAPRDLG